MEEVGLILKLILELLPMLKPDELTKLKKQLTEIQEEWNEDKQALLQALEDGDLDAINAILSKLLDLYED
jgi:hypothetical protein